MRGSRNLVTEIEFSSHNKTSLEPRCSTSSNFKPQSAATGVASFFLFSNLFHHQNTPQVSTNRFLNFKNIFKYF